MSTELWRSLRKWEVVLEKLREQGRGLLHAANPAINGVAPMRVCGFTTIPQVFHPDNRIREVTIRVVRKLSYGLIIGESFTRTHKSTFNFGPSKFLKPEPSASWVPLTYEPVGGPPSALVDRLCILTALTPDDGPDC